MKDTLMRYTTFLFQRPITLCCGLVSASLLLAACTTPFPPAGQENTSTATTQTSDGPEQQALRTMASLQTRIDRVAAPLLVNNSALCKGQARNLLGFAAKNKYSYTGELADTVQATFGYGERLQVTNVLAGSGAARVGVQRGDLLLAIEGKPAPTGENAEKPAAAMLAPLVRKQSTIKLTLQRNNAPLDIAIPLTMSCAFSFELGNADHVNAYTDSRRILITRGLVNFTQSDDELAYAMAKEMAHSILAHPAKQRMVATMDGIIDNLIRLRPELDTMNGMAGVKAYPRQLDVDADRLSLYLAARAGYNIEQAPRFWQRLASQYPASVLNGYTAIHPSTSSRLPALEKTVVEIQAKQTSGQPLLP
ncbi:MAG: M48 family metalloprotease [Proteobacteria bacterium]|nr:M48 family metalloprotease [Pseudomonadota bacterium]